jgi:predicted acyltransferase (DUF342 family)
LEVLNTGNATSITSAPARFYGGVAVEKNMYVGEGVNISGDLNVDGGLDINGFNTYSPSISYAYYSYNGTV